MVKFRYGFIIFPGFGNSIRIKFALPLGRIGFLVYAEPLSELVRIF